MIAISVGDNQLDWRVTSDTNTGNTGCGEPAILPRNQSTVITQATDGLLILGIMPDKIVEVGLDMLTVCPGSCMQAWLLSLSLAVHSSTKK